MQVVIDISEDKYSLIQCGVASGIGDWLHKIVANGTPLSRGHGDLIDRDKLELDTEWDDYYDGFTSYSEMQIKNAEVIIEGDKEVIDGKE